jgi:hypothetical protein
MSKPLRLAAVGAVSFALAAGLDHLYLSSPSTASNRKPAIRHASAAVSRSPAGAYTEIHRSTLSSTYCFNPSIAHKSLCRSEAVF